MKALIVFSSRRGFSEKLAGILAEKLAAETKVANVKTKPDPAGYDIVILGGAVIAGSLQQNMKEYAKRHLPVLLTKKVALFVSCLDKTPGGIEGYFRKSFPEQLLARAVARESLGGAMHLEQEKGITKLIMKMMKAQSQEYILTENIEKLVNTLQ